VLATLIDGCALDKFETPKKSDIPPPLYDTMKYGNTNDVK